MKIWPTKKSASDKFRERRLDKRKSLTINAVVCSEQDSAQPCIISTLSLSGMFLVLEPETRFADGTLLQLVFYSTRDNCRKVCCEWVRVVGMRESGVAVTFAHFDNQHQTNIQQMLHQVSVHTPSIPLTLSGNQQGFLTAEQSRKTA